MDASLPRHRLDAPIDLRPLAPAQRGAERAGLRRSLLASTVEGVVAEIVMACVGGAAITGWGVHLGCSTMAIGLISALPYLAQVMQLPGAWLTSRFGARTIAIATVAISRQAFLPLVALPWLPITSSAKVAILVACAAVHHGAGILCNNAWVTWMGDLVPARMRGRYFGRRTAICTFAGGLAVYTAGSMLDLGLARSRAGLVLAVLAAIASLAGAVSTWLMAQKQAAGAPRLGTFNLARVLGPCRDPAAARVMGYLAAWNAASGLAAPFFAIYLVRDLGVAFAVVALQGAVSAAARIVAAPLWGRVVDRGGSRRVLALCTAGLALSPLLYCAASADRLWPVALEAVICGALLGGHGIAAFAVPLASSPSRERPFFHAAFATAGGVAFALATALGGTLGALASHAALGPLGALRLVFVASALARLGAAALALRLEGQASQAVVAAPAAAA